MNEDSQKNIDDAPRFAVSGSPVTTTGTATVTNQKQVHVTPKTLFKRFSVLSNEAGAFILAYAFGTAMKKEDDATWMFYECVGALERLREDDPAEYQRRMERLTKAFATFDE